MANNRWDFGGTTTLSTTSAGYISEISIACKKIMIQPDIENEGPIHIGSIIGITNDWIDWNPGDIFIENVDNVRDIIVKAEVAGDKIKWQVAV